MVDAARIARPRKAASPFTPDSIPAVGAMIELQVESAPVAKHEDIVGLANDLAKQLATGPGAEDPRRPLEAAGPQPQRRNAASSGRTKLKARCARFSASRASMRIDAPVRRLRPPRRKERRAARRRRRQRRAGQGHRHARRGHEAKGHDDGRTRQSLDRQRNEPSSPNRPARKASRKTSSKR